MSNTYYNWCQAFKLPQPAVEWLVARLCDEPDLEDDEVWDESWGNIGITPDDYDVTPEGIVISQNGAQCYLDEMVNMLQTCLKIHNIEGPFYIEFAAVSSQNSPGNHYGSVVVFDANNVVWQTTQMIAERIMDEWNNRV